MMSMFDAIARHVSYDDGWYYLSKKISEDDVEVKMEGIESMGSGQGASINKLSSSISSNDSNESSIFGGESDGIRNSNKGSA